MRAFVALSLYVYLAVSAEASDWAGVHNQALGASARHEYERAQTLLRQAWGVAAGAKEKAISANDLGVTLHTLARDKEAKQWLQRAMDLWETASAEKGYRADTAESLAHVYRSMGDYEEAEQVLHTALKIDPPANSQGFLLNQLADILRETGRFAESRERFAEAIAVAGNVPRIRIDSLLGLADLDRNEHLWVASKQRWEEALTIARAHGWALLEGAASRGLADTLIDTGQTARAEPLLRSALALFDSSGSPEPAVASTLSSLARLYIADGKPGLATQVLERALPMNEKLMGPGHPQVAILYEMLGDAATRADRIDRARDYYSRAYAIMAAKFGERSAMAAAVQASWALNEQRAKLDAQAAKDYESAISVLRDAGPDTRPLLITVMRNYADALEAAHRKHEASAVRSEMKTAFAR